MTNEEDRMDELGSSVDGRYVDLSGGYIQMRAGQRDFSVIKIPIDADLETIQQAVTNAATLARLIDEEWPPRPLADPGPTAQPQRQQSRPQQQRGQQGEGYSRANNLPLFEGKECDVCGGPVGEGKPVTTARGTSIPLKCLGKCTDPNAQNPSRPYIHTAGWINDEEEAPF